jgi:hypothetical protein
VWVLEYSRTHVDDQKIIRATSNKGEDVINVGGMIRLIMCKLVDREDFPVMGEHHIMKHKRGYICHSIHVATPEQDIIIKWGINNLNFNQDGFSPKFDRDILEEPFGERWSTIISSEGDGRGY